MLPNLIEPNRQHSRTIQSGAWKTNPSHLHGYKNVILTLEFGEHRKQIRSQKPSDVGSHELLEARSVGGEPLELLDHEQALLPHLFLPPPDREARARSQRGGGRGAGAEETCSSSGDGAAASITA